MSRDMRVSDNWALLQGCQEALQRLQLASHADTAAAAAAATAAHSSPALAQPPLVVAFNLVPQFLGAGARSFCFMLKVGGHCQPLNLSSGVLQRELIPCSEHQSAGNVCPRTRSFECVPMDLQEDT
eukprot:scaffold26135_cov29-Tisochrysis_lutea.AAC.1